MHFRNWGRTASCTPTHRAEPTSEEALREVLKTARERGLRIKVVGGGHSWSDAACTDGILVSLDRMAGLVCSGEDFIEVEAGMRIHVLNDLLAERGLALGILGSIAKQSVAGALATGTHGSGPRHGSLSHLVLSLRLMRADGTVEDLTSGDLFEAALVGLGALGIITRVKLRCEPAFSLEERAEPMTFDDAIAALPSLVAEESYVKLCWFPHTRTVQVFRYRRTVERSTFAPLVRWVDENIVNRGLFSALLWLGSLFPRLIPFLNQAISKSHFRPRRMIARSDHALTIAMPPVHEEVEYALPIDQAGSALHALRNLIDREELRVNYVAELRFAAADTAWMSPAHGRGTAWLGAYMAKANGMERYFDAFEKEMLSRGGRPHWGKQFKATPPELRARLPRYEDFRALRDALDPEGRFDNAFTERVLPRRP